MDWTRALVGVLCLSSAAGCYSGVDEAEDTEAGSTTAGATDASSNSGASATSPPTSASTTGNPTAATMSTAATDDPSGSPTSLTTADPTDETDSATSNGGESSGGSADAAEAMCQRWQADRADLSEGSWSGNIGACDPGDISAEGRSNALRLVNLYRFLADLPEVTDGAGLNTDAQACALMMDANGSLSHNPPTSWACYSDAGAQAAGASNISSGAGVLSVDMYMVDFGNASTLGHRRWILSNSLDTIGLGSTGGSSCMTVIGGSGNANAAWTAFPPPGPFPFEMFDVLPFGQPLDETGWSIQSDSIALEGASVTITADGQDRPVSITVLSAGYGSSSAISIIPQGWTTQPDTRYHVEVSGVSAPFDYDVDIVACG